MSASNQRHTSFLCLVWVLGLQAGATKLTQWLFTLKNVKSPGDNKDGLKIKPLNQAFGKHALKIA